MPLFLEAIGTADRPHVPARGDSRLDQYKEWWHFNVIDDASGLDLIVNLSLSGDIRRPDGGEATLILLAQDLARGWLGGPDIYDGLAAKVTAKEMDVSVAGSRIGYADGRYQLRLSDRAGLIRMELDLTPAAEPMVVWKDTPIGRGHINWVILPSLIADGTVRAHDRDYQISNARAYHDHNWGFWRWGDNFGWDWGFCAAATEVAGAPISIVYDRTVDRAGHQVMEHSLAVWHGENLARFFARRMLTMRRSGTYRGSVRRIPGVAALMDGARVASIPARIDILAEDGGDRLEASYIPDAAIQIAIPRERGFGLVELNETLGWLTLSGSLDGEAFAATRRACFEFVG